MFCRSGECASVYPTGYEERGLPCISEDDCFSVCLDNDEGWRCSMEGIRDLFPENPDFEGDAVAASATASSSAALGSLPPLFIIYTLAGLAYFLILVA